MGARAFLENGGTTPYQILLPYGRPGSGLVEGLAGWCLPPFHQSASGWRLVRWPVFFLIFFEARHRLFVPSIADLQTARLLALDDDLAVQRAQFYLANVTTSGIDFFRNQGRAFWAGARSALRNVTASVDANGCRRGVEIGLKHKRCSLSG